MNKGGDKHTANGITNSSPREFKHEIYKKKIVF